MACRSAFGRIGRVEAGRSVTFVAELGDTVTCEIDPARTEVFRRGLRVQAEALQPGDALWITFRPGKANRAAWIQAEPDLAAERELLKEKLARAIRMLAMEGLVGFSGHVSGRLPGAESFFIHPAAKSRAAVEPSDFCEVTLEGEQLSGPSPAPDETDIHSAVYRARRDACSVLHTHSHYAVIPSLVGKDLIAVSGHGAIFGPKLPVYPEPEKICTRENAERMATLLGTGRAVVLKGHGAVVVEGTVEAVLTAALYLEENAKLLVEAMAVGIPIPMTEGEIGRAAHETFLPTSIRKTWEFYRDRGRTNGIFWDP